MARDRGAVTHDLLILGVRGRAPLLLLYGVTVTDQQITAQGYTVRYDLTKRSQALVTLEHDDPTTRVWVPQRGGLRVRVPRLTAGHFLTRGLTLALCKRSTGARDA